MKSLPAVVRMPDALRNEVVLHEEHGTNLAAQYTVNVGDIEAAWQAAEYTRKATFAVHRHTGNPLETRGLVASYQAGRGELSVWGPTKVPHFNRAILASMLDMPEHKIHFIEPDVGGGFGIRGEFYPEDFLVPFAAIKVGQPVKWIEDRREHLQASNHSREVHCDMEIAARRDGTLLGMRAHVYGDMGAYIRTHGGLVPASTAAVLTGPYRIPAYQATVSCVLTNKMGMGTFVPLAGMSPVSCASACWTWWPPTCSWIRSPCVSKTSCSPKTCLIPQARRVLVCRLWCLTVATIRWPCNAPWTRSTTTR